MRPRPACVEPGAAPASCRGLRPPMRAHLANDLRRFVSGLLFFGMAGCSRAPVVTPAPVYVDAGALSRLHPQWRQVVEMDRQIAWLSGYQPRAAGVVAVAAVNAAVPRPEQVMVDTAALRNRITSTLDEVHTREREALERRLERARQRERAEGVSAERAALEEEADRRFQQVLDSLGTEMANIDVQMSVTASLQRSYAARGAKWEDLAEKMAAQHKELSERLETTRTRRTAAVSEVFDWLEDQFRQKEAAEADAAKAYRLAHQEELDMLDASIRRQKQLLLDSLPGAPLAPTGGVAPIAPVNLAADVPALPGSGLAARIAALKARRNKLAAFILQNTKATVKSAATKEAPPVRPVFEPSTHLPDRTHVFRAAVQSPAAILEGTS